MNAKTHLPTNLLSMIACLALLVFFLPAIAADTEQDFLDSVNITVTVTQTTTQIDFDLNMTGKEFDRQNITFNDVTIKDASIQQILNGADWKFELINGSKPRFNCVCIETGSITAILLDALLDDMGAGFSVADINNDVEVLNEYLEENAPVWDTGEQGVNTTFSKKGTHYTIKINKGYQDDEVEDIIKEGVHQVHIGKLLDDLFTMVAPGALDESISEMGFDFVDDIDYTITCMHVDDLMLEDGTYNVPVKIHCNKNGQTYTENVKLILSGIKNHDMMCSVNGTYFPTNDGIKAYIVRIDGLGVNTINVTMFDKNFSGFAVPSNTVRVIKYIDISVANQTDAVIQFKVPTSKVSDSSQVDFYIREGNSWVQLETDFLHTSGGFHFYRAEIPHFSSFMILEHEPAEDENDSGSSGSGGNDNNDNDSGSNAPVTAFGAPVTELAPITTTQPAPTEDPEPNRGITGAIIDGLEDASPFVIFAILAGAGIIIMVIFRMKERIAAWWA